MLSTCQYKSCAVFSEEVKYCRQVRFDDLRTPMIVAKALGQLTEERYTYAPWSVQSKQYEVIHKTWNSIGTVRPILHQEGRRSCQNGRFCWTHYQTVFSIEGGVAVSLGHSYVLEIWVFMYIGFNTSYPSNLLLCQQLFQEWVDLHLSSFWCYCV